MARERIWVGIDVGKAAHHVHAVDAEGTVVFSRRVDNAQPAIEAVLARAAAEAGEVRWALDMTSGAAGLLIAVLHAAGQPVTYVPGKLVNRISGAFAGEGKTDAKDARTIAETAPLRTDLTVIAPADQLVVELQVLTSRRADVKADWVRGVNRIRALLGGIFPGLERVIDLSNRSPQILVPRDSGRVSGNLHRPRRCHGRLQNVFYMAAFCAINRPGPSKTYYDRKRAEGKRHAQALIALARRLVDVIWALLRDRRTFQTDPPPRSESAQAEAMTMAAAAA